MTLTTVTRTATPCKSAPIALPPRQPGQDQRQPHTAIAHDKPGNGHPGAALLRGRFPGPIVRDVAGDGGGKPGENPEANQGHDPEDQTRNRHAVPVTSRPLLPARDSTQLGSGSAACWLDRREPAAGKVVEMAGGPNSIRSPPVQAGGRTGRGVA